MKEVNPHYQNHKIDFRSITTYLVEFIKHPVKKIVEIPDWSWGSLFLVQICIAIVSGVLAGLLKFNLYRIANGLFLMPVVSTVASLLLTTFLYYYFQFFEQKTENFKKLFSLVIIASIPFYLFQIISEYLAVISLIGFAMTSALLVVGLNEVFGVDKKRCYQIIGLLLALVVFTWIVNRVTV